MNERTVRYLTDLAERLELAAEEAESNDADIESTGTLVERLMEALEGLRTEFSILRHLDPGHEARLLRLLLEDELYGANAGGPGLFDQ